MAASVSKGSVASLEELACDKVAYEDGDGQLQSKTGLGNGTV